MRIAISSCALNMKEMLTISKRHTLAHSWKISLVVLNLKQVHHNHDLDFKWYSSKL